MHLNIYFSCFDLAESVATTTNYHAMHLNIYRVTIWDTVRRLNIIRRGWGRVARVARFSKKSHLRTTCWTFWDSKVLSMRLTGYCDLTWKLCAWLHIICMYKLCLSLTMLCVDSVPQVHEHFCRVPNRILLLLCSSARRLLCRPKSHTAILHLPGVTTIFLFFLFKPPLPLLLFLNVKKQTHGKGSIDVPRLLGAH